MQELDFNSIESSYSIEIFILDSTHTHWMCMPIECERRATDFQGYNNIIKDCDC